MGVACARSVIQDVFRCRDVKSGTRSNGRRVCVEFAAVNARARALPTGGIWTGRSRRFMNSPGWPNQTVQRIQFIQMKGSLWVSFSQ